LKYIRNEVLVLIIFFAAASFSQGSDSKSEQPLVEKDYRLVEDRKEFEGLRSEIPIEKQIENDELSYLDGLMSDPLKDPNQIREKFNKLLSKKRSNFSKDMQKKRESYVRQERKMRDSFARDLESQRSDFKKRKSSRDESREFFELLDQKRKDFNAEQKEKRDAFEEKMRDDRKNFEDYARDKQSDFNSRIREFSQKRTQILKNKSDSKNGP
jgi:hypothetical protein